MIKLAVSQKNDFLNVIALEIIKRNNQELWEDTIDKYPELSDLPNYDRRQVYQALKKIKIRLKDEFNLSADKSENWWMESSSAINVYFDNFFQLTGQSTLHATADIGIGPIYPRNIATNRFLVPYFADKNCFLKISIHEISHFYFYLKVAEISQRIKLPSKNRLWVISEILVPSLINSEEIKDLTGGIPYKSYAAKDSLVKKCADIYADCWINHKDSDLFWKMIFTLEIKIQDINPEYLTGAL